MSLLITNAGIDAAINAGELGVSYKITHVAIGLTGYVPSATQTALENEFIRAPISSGSVPDSGQLHFEVIFAGNEVFEGKEIGYFLEDGTLFAVDSCDGEIMSLKRSNTIITEAFELNLASSDIEHITVEVMGTQHATERIAGIAKFATLAEAVAGTISDKFVSPETLKSAQSQLESKYLRTDAVSTAGEKIILDGGVEIVSGDTEGGFRIKRSPSSSDGDDVCDIILNDAYLSFTIDNDNDADLGIYYFNNKVNGSTVRLLTVGSTTDAPALSESGVLISSKYAAIESVNANTKQIALNVTAIATKAPTNSPTLTGVPQAPTAAPGSNGVQIATTGFVVAAIAKKAPLASPALTGVPSAPTAGSGTNTTQIATTAFVNAAVSANSMMISKLYDASPVTAGPNEPGAISLLFDTVTVAVAKDFSRTLVIRDLNITGTVTSNPGDNININGRVTFNGINYYSPMVNIQANSDGAVSKSNTVSFFIDVPDGISGEAKIYLKATPYSGARYTCSLSASSGTTYEVTLIPATAELT